MIKFKLRLPKGKPVLVLKIAISILGFLVVISTSFVILNLKKQISDSSVNKADLEKQLNSVSNKYEELSNIDQIKVNANLKAEIDNIHKTYSKAVTSYEDLIKLKESTTNTQTLDTLFTKSLVFLSDKNFASASATLADLDLKIVNEKAKLATVSAKISTNVPTSNTPPNSGYSRQSVNIDSSSFMVSMVAADLGNTKIVVDTASDSDCGNNCPVLPLASYISRNGAFAGVNGTYFCPATYPTCAGKTNTFDLLVMNKNKYYFNSGNNVYSSNPAVIFGGGYIRFVSKALEWGRDTGVNGVLSNYPLLIQDGNMVFQGDGDPKHTSRGGRSFVANKGNIVYIGVVHNASVTESAKTLKALGMENALNLDDGGSTALWSGGYRVGPGRDIPNVILFVKK